MHKRRLPNLNRELEVARAARTPYFFRQLEQIGIDHETAERLMIGRLLVRTSCRFFKPAHPNDGLARKLPVMPTSWDGWHLYDLLAFDGRRAWLRLGVEDHLGDPTDGPVFPSVGAWIKAGGIVGSCRIRGRDG